MGKTWASLDWMVETEKQLPIVLLAPASALAGLAPTELNVKKFLAERLFELTKVRDSTHWLHRVEHLLKRPLTEGSVLILLIDGLNQESSVPWLSHCKVLQGESFSGRIRVIVTTRNHHFDDKLSRLRALLAPAVSIEVPRYDASPGGELDQMLAFEGLGRADLHADLLELARTPRLFKLIIRLRDKVLDAGQVTVHRLLWEYGRDTLGTRAGRSFSVPEWLDWLREIAYRHRSGVREFSVRSLGESAARPDLSQNEICARLSDIIDGGFAVRGTSGNFQLAPILVYHALGAALLAWLDETADSGFAALDAKLSSWLDAIAGFDERAEILRACVSILIERGISPDSPLAGALVTAWLQSQNVTDNHRHEIAKLGSTLANALLDAIEHSTSSAQTSARVWAVNALRSVDPADVTALERIVARISRWYSVVSRDVDTRPDASSSEESRVKRATILLGADESGPKRIIGVDIELADRIDATLQLTATVIMDGFPRRLFLPVFERAALALAIRRRSDVWDELKWLCLLNDIDADETAQALRTLADQVRTRIPEPAVRAELARRVAALLLWLTSEESDDIVARSINPDLDRFLSYEDDYLAHPARSMFPLERRHARDVLGDVSLHVFARARRVGQLWFDPTFVPPDSFVEELREVFKSIDVENLHKQRGRTVEDHQIEQLESALARCLPTELAGLWRRWLRGMASRGLESRYTTGVRATDYLVIAGDEEASAAAALRASGVDSDDTQEDYIECHLLMLEIHGEPLSQYEAVIGAGLRNIALDLARILGRPSREALDALIRRFGTGSLRQQQNLLALLSARAEDCSDTVWSWVEHFCWHTDEGMRGLAFKTLAPADPVRFGQLLDRNDWSWRADADLWVNHYGSYALARATLALPFEQVVPRLAPWHVLEAAQLRGDDPVEVRLAAEFFGKVVFAAEQLGEEAAVAVVSVDRAAAREHPFVYSVSPLAAEPSDDVVERLRAAMDADGQLRAVRSAAEAVHARIDEARRAGANLHFVDVNPKDFAPIIQHSPDSIDRWLAGLDEETVGIRKRVLFAESSFLALCEALLADAPKRGVQLWRYLRRALRTRYTGPAGVDELLHLLFRVPESEEVSALRDEFLRKEHTRTDSALFDWALAADCNGHSDAMSSVVDTDLTSTQAWKKRRGLVLSGFLSGNQLPVTDAWPEGVPSSERVELERRSARRRWSEGCARHWWECYLAASDPDEAYAAWVLFAQCADRRAERWVDGYLGEAETSDKFELLKRAHAYVNRGDLRGKRKHLEQLDRNFLERPVVDGIGPWRERT